VSLAIHWATGGCEAQTARQQAVRIQPRNRYRCEADVFRVAEGSIWQQPLVARSGRLAGVPSPRHAPQGWPRNRRELPISSSVGELRGPQGSTGGVADESGAVVETHSTDEDGTSCILPSPHISQRSGRRSRREKPFRGTACHETCCEIARHRQAPPEMMLQNFREPQLASRDPLLHETMILLRDVVEVGCSSTPAPLTKCTARH